MKSERIIGFDLARGLAIIGMIIVNFKVVMSIESNNAYYTIMNLFTGKAAALFVILAGAGLSLMYQLALKKETTEALRKLKVDVLKRSLFLFVIGLSYYPIWPADILHYYGVYLSVATLMLAWSKKRLVVLSIILILLYPFLLVSLDYSKGWNFETLEYLDFFTLYGFIRNLIFNGFHPVIPWITFLLTGIWVGRINFNNEKILLKMAAYSAIIYFVFKLGSVMLLSVDSAVYGLSINDAAALFSTAPMPPNAFYMYTASALAVFVISVCVLIGKKMANTLLVRSLVSFGQLALSNYFFHVIIGMFGLAIVFNNLENAFSTKFVFWYSISYSLVFIVFSHQWRKRFNRGPIEALMRKITG
ncbi:MAG: DUF418 domain-containing protein [Bacteroidia bacterium]